MTISAAALGYKPVPKFSFKLVFMIIPDLALILVSIATAVVPTFIAQRWFSPALSAEMQEEVSAQEEESP